MRGAPFVVCFAVGCSFSALDGFTSNPAPVPDGGANDGAFAPPGPSAPGTPTPAGTLDAGNDADAAVATTCTPGANTACAFFDTNPVESGWNVTANDGTYDLVTSAISQPNAARFQVTGSAVNGTRFAKAFSGSWSQLECRMQIAIDALADTNAIDIAGFRSESPTFDEVALRINNAGLRLISCRDSSDCKPEVNAGGLPELGVFHAYRLVWTGAGEYQLYFDDELRNSITTNTVLTSPSLPTVEFGLFFRPFGTGAITVRYDDIACTRTP